MFLTGYNKKLVVEVQLTRRSYYGLQRIAKTTCVCISEIRRGIELRLQGKVF